MEDRIKIALFDSGVGGLNLLAQTYQRSFNTDFYYFLDREFCPYGEKSDDIIHQRCLSIISGLLEFKPDLILLACNTATAVSIDQLREKFKNETLFVGIEPYLNLVNKTQSLSVSNEKLGALVTQMTAKSKRFKLLKKERDPNSLVEVIPSHKLAKLIEDYFYCDLLGKDVEQKGFSQQLNSILAPLKLQKYHHLILGCTHYEFIDYYLEEYFKVQCHTPSNYVVNRIFSLLQDHKSLVKEPKDNDQNNHDHDYNDHDYNDHGNKDRGNRVYFSQSLQKQFTRGSIFYEQNKKGMGKANFRFSWKPHN